MSGMKLSAMVTRRVKLAIELEGTLAVHAPAASAGLDEFFAPVEDDGTGFDAETYFDVLRRKVVWWRERLIHLDLTHQEELAERAEQRGREVELAKSLYGRLVNLRRVSHGLLEEDDLVTLGLAGTVSQDPVTVQRQAEKAWKRFQGDDPKVRSSRWPQVREKLTAMADDLGPDVKALAKTVKDLKRTRRKVESAASRKRQGIRDFDRHYFWIAKSAEVHLRMAGLEDAADHVKPQARRLDRDVA